MRLWRRWYLAGAWCCLATVKQVLGNPSSSPVCQTGKHELALSGGSHNDYDYTKSTEEFYASPSSQHTGPFTNIRRTMDYSHHRVYSPARQRVQDDIILRELREGDPDSASHVDGRGVRQWIIFTAGAMGVGKSYTLQWAAPWLPEAFVLADADRLRHHLPEMNGYKERNPNTAGLLTQKEAGYMSELLAAAGLLQGRNVVIDGSMRDAAWHTRYIRHLRSQFPGVRVAILHVQAEKDVIFQRAQSRGQVRRHSSLYHFHWSTYFC
jgi:predicted kinase